MLCCAVLCSELYALCSVPFFLLVIGLLYISLRRIINQSVGDAVTGGKTLYTLQRKIQALHFPKKQRSSTHTDTGQTLIGSLLENFGNCSKIFGNKKYIGFTSLTFHPIHPISFVPVTPRPLCNPGDPCPTFQSRGRVSSACL